MINFGCETDIAGKEDNQKLNMEFIVKENQD